MKVYLGGEGPTELGSRAGDRTYQSDNAPGVLQALLRKTTSADWLVVGATTWKSIRKAKAGKADHQDTHNVVGLALDAHEAGAEALVFLRDLDRDPVRAAAIADGIRRISEQLQLTVIAVAGTPKPCIEAWLLAMKPNAPQAYSPGTESLSSPNAKAMLEAAGVASREAKVALIEGSDTERIPQDALTLHAFLAAAARMLSDV